MGSPSLYLRVLKPVFRGLNFAARGCRGRTYPFLPMSNNPEFTVLGDELASQYASLDDEEQVTDRVAFSADSFCTPGARELGEFHNSTSTKLIKHEKPWHRYALHLAARAKMSTTDIASTLQVSADQVRVLFKQKWFQEQYNALVSQRADSFYEQLLQGEDVNSLLTLVELRDNPNVKSATRASCAFDILDRMKGKAIQRTLSVSSSLKQTSDIDEMKAELVKLEAEEQALLGASAKQPNVMGVVR